jgi:hypothetical protein
MFSLAVRHLAAIRIHDSSRAARDRLVLIAARRIISGPVDKRAGPSGSPPPPPSLFRTVYIAAARAECFAGLSRHCRKQLFEANVRGCAADAEQRRAPRGERS